MRVEGELGCRLVPLEFERVLSKETERMRLTTFTEEQFSAGPMRVGA